MYSVVVCGHNTACLLGCVASISSSLLFPLILLCLHLRVLLLLLLLLHLLLRRLLFLVSTGMRGSPASQKTTSTRLGSSTRCRDSKAWRCSASPMAHTTWRTFVCVCICVCACMCLYVFVCMCVCVPPKRTIVVLSPKLWRERRIKKECV